MTSDPMAFANYDAWKLATPNYDDEAEVEPELCGECAGGGWLPSELDCCEGCGGEGEVT